MSITSIGTFLGGGSGGLKGIVNFPICEYKVQNGYLPIFGYSSKIIPVSLNLPQVTNAIRDFSSSGNFTTGKELTYNEITCRDFTINSGHQWTIDGLNIVKASRNITIGGNGIIGVNRKNRGVFLDLPYDHSPNTTKDSGASNSSFTAPLGASGGGHGDNPTETSGGIVDIPSISDLSNGIGGNGDIWDTDDGQAKARGLTQIRGFGGGQPQAQGFPFGQNGFYDEYYGFGRSNQRSPYFVTDSAVSTGSYSRVLGHGGAAGGFEAGANDGGGTCTSALVLIADSIEISASIDLSGSNAGASAGTKIDGGSGGGHGGYVFLFANTINFNGGSIDVSGGNGGPGGNGATFSSYAGGGGGGGHCGLIYAQASSFLTNTTTKTGNVGTGGSAGSPSFNASSDPAGDGSDGGYVQPWNTHYVEVEGSPF